MVSVRISKALTISLVLVTAASSALASSDTCDPGDAVDVATLRATRSYNPPRFEDDARSLQRPSWFFVPPVARVVAGQAGPFLASLIWRDSSGGIGACVYQGTGRQAHSPTCAGNGDEYRLTQCALLSSSGITFFGAEGLIREATSVRFHILAGDSCAPTISELELTSPPDRDGDGVPDCLEPPRDTSAPVWPAGSTLAGTIVGGTATLVWTAATDNVGVVGYRLFQEGQRIQDLPASTLTTTVAGLAPNAPHTFQVQALDAASNVSSNGPSTVVLEDTLAPTWPAASALSATPASLTSAILTWTPAVDNVGVVAYRVFANGLPLAQTDGRSLSTTIVGLDPSVIYMFQVQAVDAAGNASADGPQARLRIDATPPAWPSDRSLLAAVTGAQSVHLAWTAAVDDIGVVQYVVYQDDILVRTVDGNTRSADVVGLDAAATQVFRIEAGDAAGNASTNGPTASVHIGTPSPALVAPALDTNAGTTILGAFSFLTEGSNPIQTGVAPGTVVKQRAALVRGHVSDRDGVDLQDVTVTILRHPELGTTQTHLDGTFDLLSTAAKTWPSCSPSRAISLSSVTSSPPGTRRAQ